MQFPNESQHSLKLYKIKGQQWWDVAAKACDDFNEGSAVMINTEEANKDAIRRAVDFLSGAAYSQKGELVKNGTTGFVVVPANCTIGGDIGDEVFENISSSYAGTTSF
jgi:FtsZ-interacting cell division protein YlmF